MLLVPVLVHEIRDLTLWEQPREHSSPILLPKRLLLTMVLLLKSNWVLKLTKNSVGLLRNAITLIFRVCSPPKADKLSLEQLGLRPSGRELDPLYSGVHSHLVYYYGFVAQSVEQWPFKPLVVSSILTKPKFSPRKTIGGVHSHQTQTKKTSFDFFAFFYIYVIPLSFCSLLDRVMLFRVFSLQVL